MPNGSSKTVRRRRLARMLRAHCQAGLSRPIGGRWNDGDNAIKVLGALAEADIPNTLSALSRRNPLRQPDLGQSRGLSCRATAPACRRISPAKRGGTTIYGRPGSARRAYEEEENDG
jgi:hypothetical protein